jgi:beta-galactosidase/beta-glucuronidase
MDKVGPFAFIGLGFSFEVSSRGPFSLQYNFLIEYLNMGLKSIVIRGLLSRLTPYLEYICFYFIYPGGLVSNVAQFFYKLLFNWLFRQRAARKAVNARGLPDWENPAVIGRSRRRAHARSESLETVLMLTGESGVPDPSRSWQFQLVGSPNDVPQSWNEGWDSESERERAWETIALPNHWQLQGYDVPLYTNTTYPFQFDPPRARRNGHWIDAACDKGLNYATSKTFPAPLHPNEPGENATGLYRHKFCLETLVSKFTEEDGDPCNDRYFLVFEGADACMTVWLDGQFVGYSQDSCLPAEFEITAVLEREERDQFVSTPHVLAVQVSRWCDGSYLEDQDKWWLSGIYREVYIERRPSAFICDFEFSSTVRTRETVPRPLLNGYVTPGLDVLSADVIISVLTEGVRTTNVGVITPTLVAAHAVRAELWSKAVTDRPVIHFVKELAAGVDLPNRVAADSIYADRKTYGEKTAPVSDVGVATMKGTLNEPTLWTAETPHLYTLKITLHNSVQEASEGTAPLHQVTHRVGIRKISIGGPDHVLRINDAPLTLAGINRHEFDPRTGRAVSKESMRADAVLLKKLNFNAVRSSHYPQHPYWLQVCDEVGLYVIDEANIESHGFQILGQPVGYLADQPEWELALTARVTRMYERDKNHACIIGWSLGNESGHGKAHDIMACWLRLRDSSRFVQYESGGARTAATDLVCPMYTRPVWCEEQSLRDTKKRPVVLCEYAHAMGNSGGCLATYWQLFRDPKYPRVQGGFIWDFVDQGLLLPDGEGYGYGGDFGDLPNTKQFCCNGIARPNRELLPGAYEAAHLQCPVEITLVFDATHNPVLIVTNRRACADLSDIRLSVRPCCHSGEVNRYTLGKKFEFNAGPIIAGSFRKFDIVENVRQCLNFGQHGAEEASPMISSAHIFGLSEAWLEVAVVSHPGTHGGLDESYELMRTAFTSSTVKSAFQRLSHGAAISPLPPLLLPPRNTSFGALESNASTHSHSCASSVPSSPFPQLDHPTAMNRRMSHGGQESHEDIVDSCHPEMSVHVEDMPGSQEDLVVRWGDGSLAIIGRSCGRLLSWTDKFGQDLIAAPVEPCFYRAGTDNDKGGGMLSYYTRWKEVGLDRLVHRAQANAVGTPRGLSTGALVIATSWVLESPRDAEIYVSFQCEAKYTFDPCGTIDVAFSAVASANVPPLARCGLRWAMPERFAEVKYFGLGPHEAYDDRLASVYLGVFESSVPALHTHYTVPQECGRRADPRYDRAICLFF